MNNKVISTLVIGAVSLLLIDLILAMPAEANVFRCRASAFRVMQTNGGVIEPVVANPADAPCTTQDVTLLSESVAAGAAQELEAKTFGAVPHSGIASTAEGKVASVDLVGLIVTAGVIDAKAAVTPTGGVCLLTGSSSVWPRWPSRACQSRWALLLLPFPYRVLAFFMSTRQSKGPIPRKEVSPSARWIS